MVAPDEIDALFAGAGDPSVFYGEGIATEDVPAIVAVVVRDARILPDGRVGAVVEWRGPRGGAGPILADRRSEHEDRGT